MKEFSKAQVFTAIKTPFSRDGAIDLAAFDRLVQRQIEAGIDGLIIGGTTGEGHLLNWDEHVMLIGHTVHRFGDRLLVVGNTGSNNTKEASQATQHGFAIGMDAALLINPYYGKTSPAGMVAHFKKLLELGPAIVYNVPGRTGQDISPSIIAQLQGHPNLLGLKECAGTERISGYEAQGIPCWSGNDDEAHKSRHEGASHGVISVTSNLLPKAMKTLMAGKNETLNGRLQPLFAWLFSEPNPIALNTALAMLGWVQPVFRLPYVPMSKEMREKGAAILNGLSDLGELTPAKVLEDSDFLVL
ncbi:MAG: 4-hydroxy-tetrahydrodipicolinate synthase [Candidatus Lambdaproteobacteria bacterium RIFOXYD1_FULL_56_27]|uniref:4-hydroxy-tetrahydrodipicolinate synthase n=1 Tax=Candidatus Lambdaproteobacteria bacterium RIFOXYD2_FULL_56_26 TaxID=1817773 RepID=A0A1F6GMU5_9PROT|nr:MAG: 4-hydroxy-tetrahydrodipicolinate synthase [Candidatus Lambdaproteobacteria bacterium RIFOXYD2_FULL_56_26]OGH05604.1 MAG: 4-hydroxy-tetrahydrodipicolinate synthase [Candidatus Lambdaproteobacteria bacterium RIFOXYC1_FULL_56_13]OGH08564.1 MAG: 4-hydroxy-tetrahydrodipicolinate synthase [Candidatus Lambdaproteobacteria bacterium RIFOXYD1_FULL_56_27]